MKKISLVAVIAACLVAPNAAQSSLAGKWTVEEATPSGKVVVTLQLRVDRNRVTGTVTTGQDPQREITDAVVRDNQLTFKTIMTVRGNDMTFAWTCDVKGDEMVVIRTNTVNGRNLAPLTLRRSR